LDLTTKIVSASAAKAALTPAELIDVISSVSGALSGLIPTPGDDDSRKVLPDAEAI
jgi:predicted transcriptional regulator